MAKITTENFRVQTSKSLFNSINNSAALNDTYYIMASSVDKENTISNTQKEKYDFQRRIIFGNKITVSDVRYMFYKNNWVSGTVYDDFDDEEDFSLTNSIVTVPDDEGNYLVFKCIENNNGEPSTAIPSLIGINTASYETSTLTDKYIWKYMFTVSSSDASVYGTPNSLPLPYPAYGDVNVIAGAKESISQIIIEETPDKQFSAYLFGAATNISNGSDVIVFSSIQSGGTNNLVVSATINATKVGFSLYTNPNAYTNMYLKTPDGKLYEVLTSSYVSSTKISITVSTTDSIPNETTCQLVPKINVSRSPGQQCEAYGILDQFGTLSRIGFKSKGTEYKYATAEVAYPGSLIKPGTTTLRCVVSPKGGHGSDPITEMAMSRLAVITNFSGEPVTILTIPITIPNTNTYTKVGLVKNPTFTNGLYPASFDNRATIVLSGDQSTLALKDYYVQQYITAAGVSRSAPSVGQTLGIGEERISARIHETVYNSTLNKTTIYLVDYYGNFESSFVSGTIYVKPTESSTTATQLSINNASTDVVYGKYAPYTGELLHYVDFQAITRQSARKEKIKFIFDF